MKQDDDVPVRLAERRQEMNPDDARALYMAANGLVALGKGDKGLRLKPKGMHHRTWQRLRLQYRNAALQGWHADADSTSAYKGGSSPSIRKKRV